MPSGSGSPPSGRWARCFGSSTGTRAGLQLGLFYFPPALRRQVYGALGLAVVVPPDGSLEIEGHFDAEAIRLTREVEEHALALREAEGRANATPVRGAAEGWQRLERDLIRVRNEQTPRP